MGSYMHIMIISIIIIINITITNIIVKYEI